MSVSIPQIPGLEIAGEIGRGAQSIVYAAQRKGRSYAVKIPAEPIRTTPAALRQFRREAGALACVRHPALPTVVAVGETPAFPYLVMEPIHGTPLADILAEGPLPEQRVVAIGQALAGALKELHRYGLIHRDVKPANVIIDTNGRAILIDLGLVRSTHHEPADEVVGTLRYAAPEQTGMLQRPVDGRSDLYALGVVLFECATGSPPFRGTDPGTLVHQHAAVSPPDVREWNPAVSPALAAIIAKLLAKDPDDRYQSASGLLADLTMLPSLNAQLAAGAPAPLGLADDPADFRSPLVGRESELAACRRAIAEAVAGTGPTLVISGVSGSGKSHLVHEFVDQLPESDAPLLFGHCLEPPSVPFAPIRAAIDHYLDRVRQLPPTERQGAEAQLRAAAGSSAWLLARCSPGLAELFGPAPDADGSDLIEDPLPTALGTFLLELARLHGHAILVIEDVQWLDEASRRVLRHCAHATRPSQLLLIMTVQTDAMADELPAVVADLVPDRSVHLPLGPLSETALIELVTQCLGGHRIAPDVLRQIATLSAGLPYAAIEFVRTMVETGVIRPMWDQWLIDAERLSQIGLPTNVVHLLEEQVVGLSEPSRRLLQAAVVLGAPFRLDEAAMVADLTAEEANEAIADPGIKHLVQRTTDGTYSVIHDRIRELVRAQIPPAEWRRLHLRAAEALVALGSTEADAYRLARHYAEADTEQGAEEAVAANLAAGMQALNHFAYANAYEFLAAAREIAANHGLVLDLAAEKTLAEVCTRVGRLDEALAHADRALRLTSEPIERARLRAQAARIHLWNLDFEPATTQVDAAFQEIGEQRPSFGRSGTGMAHALGAWASFVTRERVGQLKASRPDANRERLRVLVDLYHLASELVMFDHGAARELLGNMLLALRAAQALGPSRELVTAYVDYGLLLATLGKARGAKRYYRRAIDLAQALGDRQRLAHALLYEGIAMHFAGRPQEAEELVRRCLAEHGDWLSTAEYLNGCGDLLWNLLLRGHLREALIWIERAQNRATGATPGPAALQLQWYMDAFGLAVHDLLGQEAAAREHQRRAEAFGRERPEDAFFQEILLSHRLLALVEQGEVGDEVEAIIARFHTLGLRPGRGLFHLWRFYVVQAYARLAQCDAAPPEEFPVRRRRFRAALDDLRRATDHPTLRCHYLVLAAASNRHDLKYQEALDQLDQAMRLADDHGNLWARYEAMRQRALVLQALDKPAAAARYAREALALAQEQGWVHHVQRLRAEFPTAMRSTPAGQDDVLTPSTDPQALRLQRHLDALLQVSLAAGTVLDPALQARAALDAVIRILGAERGLLFMLDDEGLRLEAGRDATRHDLTPPVGFSQTVVDAVQVSGEPMIVNGTEEGPVLGSESIVAQDLRSIIAAPLMVRGRLIGVVYLDNRLARGVFTEDDLTILRAVASQVAIARETGRVAHLEARYESEHQQRRLAEALRDLLDDLTSTLNLPQVLDRLLTHLGQMVPYDSATVVLRHGDALEVAIERSTAHAEQVTTQRELRAMDRLLTEVITTSRPRVVADTEHDPRLAAPGLPSGIRSWLAVPLLSEGTVVGVVILRSHTPAAFGEHDADIALTFTGQAGIAIANARLFAEVRRLAVTDDLTGVRNRRYIVQTGEAAFQDARERNEPLSLILLDVDQFKRVNDTYGHAIGDEVLQGIADRLRQHLRDVDHLGRYGGEEFTIILPGIDSDGAHELAERLRRAIGDTPITTQTSPVSVTISMGVATVDRETPDFSALLQRADGLLYAAKRQGRNRVVVG